MADRIKVKIPSGIAPFLRSDVSAAVKIKALAEPLNISAIDQMLMIMCLVNDSDLAVKSLAATLFKALSPESLVQFIESGNATHPVILDMIARNHHSTACVVSALLNNEALSPSSRQFLQNMAAEESVPELSLIHI